MRLDQDLGAQRDLVTKTKHERDEHRPGTPSGTTLSVESFVTRIGYNRIQYIVFPQRPFLPP